LLSTTGCVQRYWVTGDGLKLIRVIERRCLDIRERP
jgi:hypothetical protein